MFSSPAVPPPDWEPVFVLEGRQMLRSGGGTSGAVDTGVVELGAADVPEMLDLVARTRPGPFWPRTRELGTYLGIRDGGRLVAMAGERLRPPGWTEISAVCTDPEVRGRGTPPAWWARSPTGSWPGASAPSRTWPRRTRRRSRSTSGSASRPGST